MRDRIGASGSVAAGILRAPFAVNCAHFEVVARSPCRRCLQVGREVALEEGRVSLSGLLRLRRCLSGRSVIAVREPRYHFLVAEQCARVTDRSRPFLSLK